jgi:cytochrome c peroxidase
VLKGCLLLAAFSLAALAQSSFHWDLPKPFPLPSVPADNPMSVAKVELGRRLFYDQRMSVNGRESCASCHKQQLAFTDGRAQAEGSTGQLHPRSSMSLANVAYNPSLTWDDPAMRRLEEQALIPILGTEPVELGLKGSEARFLSDLRRDPIYQPLFREAFGGDAELYTMNNVAKALAAFERTIISVRSPYDRYRFDGDTNALSDAAKRGEILFFSGERTACFQCHGGWNFNGAVVYAGGNIPEPPFRNTGLYNIAGAFSYPQPNTGLYRHTGRIEDVGKFRIPTLRNIAVTAPYMHDGSVETLEDAIDHYAAGGRTIANGSNAGVGRDNRNKASNVQGFTLTPAEKKDLIAFLESLTDPEFLNDPRFANPWK